jgi:beta-lactamase regulating signal transducer with metallopeptidase domain
MNGVLDSALLGAVLDAAVRGTFILLAALGATALMRGASASARHLVWMAALSALLLLPIARGFVPEWRVLPVPATVLAPAAADPAPRIATPSASLPEQAAPLADAPGAVARPAPQPLRLPTDWKALALLAWAAGVALFGLRLAYGLARVWWMERRAVELTDDEWVRLTDGLSRRLRLGRIVRLLREPAATVPMTWGVFRPVILLPGEADGWESERRRVVLAHELAHVRRWDALTQWIAHVALAVYWFNPLVWVAARKMREEREHACDDAVLEIGTAPADYADHLLTIVRSLGSAPGPAAALAMARRSQFEGRLLAILDNAVRRNGVSRAAGLATVAAALACLVPLAAMRPAERFAADGARADAEQVAETSSPQKGLAERVVEAVQNVAMGRGPDDAARRDARSARGHAAQTTDAAVPGSGAATAPAEPAFPAPAVAPAPTAGGVAGLLHTIQTRQDPGLYAEIIRAAEDIGSSTDRRLVLGRLLEKSDLSHDNVVAIMGATRTMESDTDKRIVLERAVRHPSLRANPLPHVFYEALRTFTSSTDQRVVLTSLLEARRLDSVCLELVFQHLSRMESDTDERVVLQKAAQTQRIQGAARQAYLAAARSMDSDTDRTVVLNALMDLDEARSATGAARSDLDEARNAVARPAPAAPPGRQTGTSRRTLTREDSGEQVWTTVYHVEGTRDGVPVTVDIVVTDAVYTGERWNVRGFRPGGSLLVEERVGGRARRVGATRNAAGNAVWSYSVDGRTQPFDAAARRWMENLVRESGA